MKTIKKILVDQIGWVYADEKDPITRFTVNGEMALVDWYRKGNQEWNGKYVIEITYNEEESINQLYD